MRVLVGFVLALSRLLLGVLAQNRVFVEENDPSLVFSPPSISWNSNQNPQPGPNGTSVSDYFHNDGYLWIDVAGASISFAFDGSYIAYVSDLYFTHGEMEIDLDGQKTRITSHSNRYPEGTPQVKLFEANVDPNMRNHVIKLTNLENKTMALDYFLFTPLLVALKTTSPVSTSSAEGDSSETTPIHTSPPLQRSLSPNRPSSTPRLSEGTQTHDVDEIPSPSTLPTATVGTAGDSTPGSGSPPMSTTTVILVSFVSSLTLVLVVMVGVFCVRRRQRQRNDADAIRDAASHPLSLVQSVSSVVPFLLHPASPGVSSGKGNRVEPISPTSPAAGPAPTWNVDYITPPSYAAAHTSTQ